MIEFITPDWPAPANVRAYTTLRNGGASIAPFNTFNLATHVGDDEKNVLANRQLLTNTLNLPLEPLWLNQTHGTVAIDAAIAKDNNADASFTNKTGQPCVVMSADCLPVLICNRKGTHVAAIHAGWRGLAHGIIENTLRALNLPCSEIMAWLGPAIGPTVFEVGSEVREVFLQNNANTEQAFHPSSRENHWLGNLYLLATLRLQMQGVSAIYGGNHCTYTEEKYFFSYRRDNSKTGRIATLIWMT